jgi:hypothetical protein
VASRNRLLILSCSRRKSREPELVPALARYNGPLFQIVRRFADDHGGWADQVDVFILSAEFGLIPGNASVPYYDRQMTPLRARELLPGTLAMLGQIVDGLRSDLFISVGADYLEAMCGYETCLPAAARVHLSTGSLGRRQAELRDWLRGPPEADEIPHVPTDQIRCVRVRGAEISMSQSEAIERVQRALRYRPGGARRFQSWYVDLDGQRVAPKWFISCLTGVAVRDFTTDDARRALRQLGIPAQRVLYM